MYHFCSHSFFPYTYIHILLKILKSINQFVQRWVNAVRTARLMMSTLRTSSSTVPCVVKTIASFTLSFTSLRSSVMSVTKRRARVNKS